MSEHTERDVEINKDEFEKEFDRRTGCIFGLALHNYYDAGHYSVKFSWYSRDRKFCDHIVIADRRGGYTRANLEALINVAGEAIEQDPVELAEEREVCLMEELQKLDDKITDQQWRFFCEMYAKGSIFI